MIELKPIGQSPDRFFILMDGRHAGGITVHSVEPPSFSYGIAIAPAMRRRGAARGALAMLFARMRARGFSRAVVQVAPDNAASLALHAALGFAPVRETDAAVTLSRAL